MTMTARNRQLARVLGGLGGFVVVATALIGLAHTKVGRPLRPLLVLIERVVPASTARCPLGYDVKATPEAREVGRRQFARAHAGPRAAGARPALGFSLDVTSRSDVQVWAAAHSIRCTPPRAGADLECTNVPASALPAEFGGVGLQSLWLNFGVGDRLVAVRAIGNAPDVAPVSDAFVALTATMRRRVGQPAKEQGEATAASLAAGALKQASAEYRFKDYYAIARATNLGPKGFALTEEYRSLPN